MKWFIKSLLCLAFFWPSADAFAQFYQGMQNEFGQNRVQYREFLWQYYRFEDYDVYFYEGGQNLAAYTGIIAEEEIKELEEYFDYALNEKIDFVVYRTQAEYRQSNLGLVSNNETNIGGTARIVGNKVFTYFGGDYQQYRRNIREGIAQVIISQLIYGGNWRDVVRNSTSLALPQWYVEGLVQHVAGNWNSERESRLKSGITTGKFRKFNRLEGDQAVLCGQGLWRYVEEVYGVNVIPNILYMSRISRNAESGFLFVLGLSLQSITDEYNNYYKDLYAAEEKRTTTQFADQLDIKVKKTRVVTQFGVSPNGRYGAYTTNELGQIRVYYFDTQTGKSKKIFKADHKLERIQDYSYPVMAWHPNNQLFSFVTEQRGYLFLYSYNIADDELVRREILNLDKVVHMSYSPDGQRIAFSGVLNGQNDLYLYYVIGNRQEQLTNDGFDDLMPSFTSDGEHILFSSNRYDDTLRWKDNPVVRGEALDVFKFNLANRGELVERITQTPDKNELFPAEYDSVSYTYLAQHLGVYNRHIARVDSSIAAVDTTISYRYFTVQDVLTDYSDNILDYQVHPRYGRYSTLFYRDGKYRFHTGTFNNDSSLAIAPEVSEPGESIAEPAAPGIEPLPLEEPDFILTPEPTTPEINIYDYQFQGEENFTYQRGTIQISEATPEGEAKDVGETEQTQSDLADGGTRGIPRAGSLEALTGPERYKLQIRDAASSLQGRNYNVNYAVENVQLTLDNTYQTQFYQPLWGAENLNPGLSSLMTLSASDLFEDYRLIGGFRLGLGLDNTTYFLAFENLKKRADKRFWGQRVSNRIFDGNTRVDRLVSYTGGFRLSYPLNEVFSIRGSIIQRFDQFIQLALDNQSLNSPNREVFFTGLKAELVFDNSLPRGLNLFQGYRAKVWGEYYRNPLETATSFMTFGLDARQYVKIHRSLTWANRFAASTSLGSQRLVYFLGGVDNWLFPQTDNSLPLDPEQNYQFQTMATPMRGFFYNSRNGNSMAILSSELRWPIFRYLLNRPIKSDFIENFQLVGFADAGSAWSGLTPYSDENFFNNQFFEGGPIRIEVKNNRDPIIYGYGVGARSRIMGYFVRVDWAWGRDDGVRLPSVLHLSLSLDF